MEADKKKIGVVIGGKTYNLAGLESEEYMEMVASYLDSKIDEIKQGSSPNVVYEPSFPIILALNIADDLFKERENKANTSSVVVDKKIGAAAEERNKELIKELNAQKQGMTELKTQYSGKANDYQILLNQFEAKSNEVDGLKTIIINREDTIENLERKLSIANGDIDELKAKLSDKEQHILDLNAKIVSKNQELNTLSKKLNEKNVALNELNQKAAERNQKLSAVNKERDELAVKLKSANSTIKTNEETISKLNDDNKSLQFDKDNLIKDVASVKEQFDMFKSSLSVNDGNQLKTAFAKVKSENIELQRTIQRLEDEKKNS